MDQQMFTSTICLVSLSPYGVHSRFHSSTTQTSSPSQTTDTILEYINTPFSDTEAVQKSSQTCTDWCRSSLLLHEPFHLCWITVLKDQILFRMRLLWRENRFITGVEHTRRALRQGYKVYCLVYSYSCFTSRSPFSILRLFNVPMQEIHTYKMFSCGTLVWLMSVAKRNTGNTSWPKILSDPSCIHFFSGWLTNLGVRFGVQRCVTVQYWPVPRSPHPSTTSHFLAWSINLWSYRRWYATGSSLMLGETTGTRCISGPLPTFDVIVT